MEVPIIISRVFGPDKIIKASLCRKRGLEMMEFFSELSHQHLHASHPPGKSASPNTRGCRGEGRGLAEAKATPWVWALGAAQVGWLERGSTRSLDHPHRVQSLECNPALPFKALLLASF